jgi:ketosteroid isomerase-like protein
MKKTLITLGLCAMLYSCAQEQRYTMQSPEIDAIKSMFEMYNKGDFDGQRQFYAENAQVFNNALESDPTSVDSMLQQQKDEMGGFSSYAISIGEDAIEMVTTDKGEKWVNVWGTWKATMAATGQTFEIPVHSTYQFVEGKITREHGYWDNSPVVIAFMEYEAAQKAATDTLP